MTIPKDAQVILVNDGRQRQGKVLRQVAPQVVQNYDGTSQTILQYEVQFDAAGDLPAHTGVYPEDALTPIPHDSRWPRP